MIHSSIRIMKNNFEFRLVHRGPDQLLREVVRQAGISKRALTDIKFQGGTLLVNGQEHTVRKRITDGDVVTIVFPPEKMSDGLITVNKPLVIVYEDDHLLIVDKPPGLPSIPSKDHPHDSLANRIAGYYIKKEYLATVHMVTRLDRDTSGLVLVAKHRHAHHQLSLQLQNHRIDKRYYAVVEGHVKKETDVLIAPIARKGDSIIERHVSPDGKFAKTEYRVKMRLSGDFQATLVDIKLWTGRTHQIRVHMAYMGHPLLGDDLYGGSMKWLNRQALHAYSLMFQHPLTLETCLFTSPFPPDIENVVKGGYFHGRREN
ncbi:RluA family pseudouridine synthase [Chryseomicrobium palamuruense]|uniref:Pseudouridine synthase n=1 Tax=Chryseomicrobium palamuruense TaxID=682973 RepID=A0ABV8UQS4_9BACL